MRRPGYLGGMNYWFGDVATSGLVKSKLEEIRLANIANHTPLTKTQQLQRIKDHLKNPRKLSQMT